MILYNFCVLVPFVYRKPLFFEVKIGAKTQKIYKNTQAKNFSKKMQKTKDKGCKYEKKHKIFKNAKK